MIKIGIHGASGKMGREVIALLPEYQSCIHTHSYSASYGGNLGSLCSASDVIIDFSNGDAIEPLLAHALASHTKLLIGTTGISPNQHSAILQSSDVLPILYAANTSFGANILDILVAKAAAALDQSYDIEILEMHHRNKKDAPSGTALMLGHHAANARGVDFVMHDHQSGVRPKDAIGFSAMRGGGVTGQHSVIFAGTFDSITIEHKAENRRAFAEGAIKAAIWLSDKQAGLYNLRDVLGL